MQEIKDIDIIQLVKYSYMDLSDAKEYKVYKNEVNKLIKMQSRIGETDKFLKSTEGLELLNSSQAFQGSKNKPIRFNFTKNLNEIRKNNRLNKLIIIAHINDDVKIDNEKGTGLVAYAFKQIDTNEIIFLCRGSEGGIFSFVPNWVEKIKKKQWVEIFKSEDWRDNFNMIYHDSMNFEPLRIFVKDVMESHGEHNTKFSAFGHSKGGGLAIYLAALFENMGGAAVDGVGLPISTYIENLDFISRIKKSRLRNIVAENDIVGSMLVHLEKKICVKMKSEFENEKSELVNPNEIYAFNWAHYPDAIFLDEDGMVEISRKKRFLSTTIGIINKMIMLLILYEKLSEGQKNENKDAIKHLKDKSIALLDSMEIF